MLRGLVDPSRLEGIDDTTIVGSHEVVSATHRPIDSRHQSRQQQLIASKQDVIAPRPVLDTRGQLLELRSAELDASQRRQRLRSLQQLDHR